MALERRMEIADIVLEHSECARVLLAHGVDLCHSRGATLDAACAARRLDPGRVFDELVAAARERVRAWPEADWGEVATPALIAHIIDRHHGYLRGAAPALRAMADKVARDCGAGPDVSDGVREVFDIFDVHLDYEERSLFPRLMMHAGGPLDAAVRRNLAVSQADHADIGRALARLRDLARGDPSSRRACTTYRVFMRELEHLERDLRRHSYLEGEVLIPRFAP